MAALKIYNSLAREKQVFEPINPDHIRIYACGPTVYNYAHIGNARMAVVFDLLARVLRQIYPKVTYASNLTDVDDKIITASRETGAPISEITEKFARIYNEDMAALGVSVPDIQPKATDHIGDMITLCEQLIARGNAYAADGHVLFHVPSFPAYGGLSGRSRDEQIAGARVEVASYKKDPADFVLWKPSHADEPGWDSPWGRGRPGWHIECSAMSEHHLGLPFDIHGGGADLKFPHHENEIAQSCCAHGMGDNLAGYAKYWMHNGFVTVDGEKMSKSLGNFTLAHDLLDTFPGEALRLTLLSAHYRQPLDWSESKIRENKKLLDRLYKRLDGMADIEAEVADIPSAFFEALCDDLNVPRAMAELSQILQGDDNALLKGQLLTVGGVLGILQQSPADWFAFGQDASGVDTAAIDALVAQRAEAKASKDWARADEIRNQLAAMNVVVMDSADGSSWSFKS